MYLPSTSQGLTNYSRSTRFRASMEPRYAPLQCISVNTESRGEGRVCWWVVSNCSPRGVWASEKITILFFAHLLPDDRTPALSARTTPADSPTRLCEIIDVEITGKDERVYCFAVEHVERRPEGDGGIFRDPASAFPISAPIGTVFVISISFFVHVNRKYSLTRRVRQ